MFCRSRDHSSPRNTSSHELSFRLPRKRWKWLQVVTWPCGPRSSVVNGAWQRVRTLSLALACRFASYWAIVMPRLSPARFWTWRFEGGGLVTEFARVVREGWLPVEVNTRGSTGPIVEPAR